MSLHLLESELLMKPQSLEVVLLFYFHLNHFQLLHCCMNFLST